MGRKPNPSDMLQDTPPEVDKSPKVYEKTPKDHESPMNPDYEAESQQEQQPYGNFIDLPSKGALGYPSQITHREVMAGDEEVLKTATNKNFSRTVNSVLKNVCNNVEFFDDMYIGDRDYILTHIWANTYDNVKEFQVTCRHCGNKDETSIDMFELDNVEISEDYRPRFPLKIQKTGDTIYLRAVTIRDDNNAEKFLAAHPKEENSYEMIHYALAVEFGRPMSTAQRIEYFKKNVSAKEMGIIKEYHRYFKFGLDTSFEHTCGECEGVTRAVVPFQPDDIIAPEVRTDFEQLLRTE